MNRKSICLCLLALLLLLTLTACGAASADDETSISLSAKEEKNPVMDKALERLKSVSKDKLGLEEDVSAYKAVFSDSVLEVDGVDCQGIILLEQKDNQLETVATFAVATDDSKIFQYDIANDTFVLVEE